MAPRFLTVDKVTSIRPCIACDHSEATITATASPRSFSAAPGSIVIVRDQEWLVTGIEGAADGFFVRVIGLSELVRDTEAVFSTAIDEIIEHDPAAATVVGDESNRFRRARLWLEAMLRKTPVAIADPGLTMAHRGLVDPLDYQLKAAAKALDPDKLRPRILLADAVGLGKTIEIGMILSELVRRGRGERILIVTPKHVLEQMQMELWTRFALPFVRLDSAGIQRIRQVLPGNRNPFTYYKRVIISIDTLKSDRYIAHLSKQRWDAVVIDESHNVTNVAAQNNRLARTLAPRTDALILASATPHNGRAESFAEMIRLLDPSAVAPDGELDLAQVAKLVIRRHRHHPDVAGEVGADWAERLPPRNIEVPASAAENAIATELEQVWLWPESGKSPYSGKTASLFPWVLAKAFLSSPEALTQTTTERDRRLDPDDQATAAERAALTRLTELAAAVPMRRSAKYAALRTELDRIGIAKDSPARVVIFAERVATLDALADAVAKDLKLTRGKPGAPGQVTVLHGGLSDADQQSIVESFKLASSPIRVLVTGDVASEGVNLHSQCHHLIHYDIPWSLIRIEQRNGRIDRYGQRHRPEITTLLLAPSTERFGGDFRVLTKLVEREHEAHTALGDSASLIGTYDVKAEEEAVRRVIARGTDLDEVVRPVDEVVASGGLEGFLAMLATGAEPAADTTPGATGSDTDTEAAATLAALTGVGSAPEAIAAEGSLTGVYDSEFEFLADALEEFVQTPHLPPPNGVSWTVHERQSVASLQPPVDLMQRLQVLPQDYLRDRKVTETFKLAYTKLRGQQELRQAKEGASLSSWPEAHYLAPLHPIVEWAADRALSELGRDEIFAVRGDIDLTTVLVQATQTNARGQVVASSYLTVGFFDPADPATPLVSPHPSAAAAIAALEIAPTNRGGLDGAERLGPLVAAAVRAADQTAARQAEEIRAETQLRIDEWVARTERWQDQAQQLTQRLELVRRTDQVANERELARTMNPERRLIRPLLVVVPADTNPAVLPPLPTVTEEGV